MTEPTSPQPAPQSPRRPSRLRRFGRRLLYLLLILLAVHLTATAITGVMLSRELARLRARGEPLRLQDMAPKVPAGERNAADVYQQAFDSLRLSEQEKVAVDDVAASLEGWDPPTPEERLLARQAVAANSRYFALLEEASRIPACAFPVKWGGDPLAMMFPHLARLRQAARRLALHARFASDEGRPDDAARDFLVIMRIEDHIQREPTVIALLVACALQSIAMKELPRTLSSGDPSADLLRQLQAQVQVLRQADTAGHALRGERACSLAIFDLVRARKGGSIADLTDNGERPSRWRRLALASYPTLGRPLLNLDELTFLRFSAQTVAAADLPYPASMDQLKAAREELERTPLSRAYLARMISPVLERAIMTFALRDARLGLDWYAAQLKLCRYQHGRYPAALPDLPSPPAPLSLDPFSGQPYHYRLEGDGFRLWSVGENGVDDGGSDEVPKTGPGGPKKPHNLYGPLDLVVRVTR